MDEQSKLLLENLTKSMDVSFKHLEHTLSTSVDNLRDDFQDMKATVTNLAQTQATQGERILVAETKVSDVQTMYTQIGQLQGDIGWLRAELAAVREKDKAQDKAIESNAPARTPWPSIVSAIVAIGALAYAMFGR